MLRSPSVVLLLKNFCFRHVCDTTISICCFLVTRRLKQQLQACSGFDVEHAETWNAENLGDDAKQKALVLAHLLNAQYARWK